MSPLLFLFVAFRTSYRAVLALLMSGRTYCFFNITFGGVPAKEQIVFELFDDVTPKTCENFRQLCLGCDGKMVEGTNVPLSYKGCSFHRIIKGFMSQGGDFTNHNGTGGVSIFGEKFEDENFNVPCDKAGLLCMANAGPNTNGSQFFITADAAHHLTGKHVVFGRVVRGMSTTRYMNSVATGQNDTPVEPVLVADCGVLAELPPVPVAADGDRDPDYPEDCEPPLSDKELVEAGERIRQLGNQYFAKAEFPSAIEKYGKAARFLDAAIPTSADGDSINEKRSACHSNTAMCYIKLSKWSDARRAADAALKAQPNNAKALYRRATASLCSGDTDSAIADFKSCKALDPSNAEIDAKLQEAQDMDKKQKAKLAAGFKKMFS